MAKKSKRAMVKKAIKESLESEVDDKNENETEETPSKKYKNLNKK